MPKIFGRKPREARIGCQGCSRALGLTEDRWCRKCLDHAVQAAGKALELPAWERFKAWWKSDISHLP